MDERELRNHFIARFGIRIEPEMSRYVLGRMQTGAGSIPVMGDDARTGVAIRRVVDLSGAMDAPSPSPD